MGKLGKDGKGNAKEFNIKLYEERVCVFIKIFKFEGNVLVN